MKRIASVGPKVPVFLKLKPARDPSVLQEIVRLADEHRYIAGFGINLPTGKPRELSFASPRETWAHLPGAVSGRPVEAIINTNLRMLRDVVGPRSRYTVGARSPRGRGG